MIEGRAVKLGDDVNTDVIIAGRYLNETDVQELGRHLLETYDDPEVAQRIAPGDVLVAGENFGSGSSREHAPIAIRARGVQAVVAASFARIFLRNAINLALPVVESPEAARALADGETVRIDLAAGTIEGSAGRWSIPPPAPFVREVVADGGLVPWVRRRLEAGADPSSRGRS